MSLKRSVFYTVFTQVPNALMQILSGIFITRLIGDEGRGIYAILTADIALFAMIMGLGVEMGLKYFISQGKLDRSRVIGLSIIVALLNMVLFTLILLAHYWFQPTGETFIPNTPYDLLIYLYLFAGFTSSILTNTISAVFQGLLKFRVVNQMTLLNSALVFICFGGYFAYAYDLRGIDHLYVVLWLQAGVMTLNSILWILRFLGSGIGKPNFRIGKKLAGQVIGYSLLGYASNVLNLLNYRLDIWVLHHYGSTAKVGLYSVAVSVAQLFWMIPNPIASVLQPYLNSPDKTRRLVKFKLYSRLNTSLVVIGACIAFFLAPLLIPLVYGDEFAGSVLALQILLPGIVFSCLSKIFSILILNSGKVYYNLLATAIGLIITIVLDFTLIPKYGIIGASIATSCTYASIFITVYIVILRKLKMPSADYFIFRFKNLKELKKL